MRALLLMGIRYSIGTLKTVQHQHARPFISPVKLITSIKRPRHTYAKKEDDWKPFVLSNGVQMSQTDMEKAIELIEYPAWSTTRQRISDGKDLNQYMRKMRKFYNDLANHRSPSGETRRLLKNWAYLEPKLDFRSSSLLERFSTTNPWFDAFKYELIFTSASDADNTPEESVARKDLASRWRQWKNTGQQGLLTSEEIEDLEGSFNTAIRTHLLSDDFNDSVNPVRDFSQNDQTGARASEPVDKFARRSGAISGGFGGVYGFTVATIMILVALEIVARIIRDTPPIETDLNALQRYRSVMMGQRRPGELPQHDAEKASTSTDPDQTQSEDRISRESCDFDSTYK